MSSREKEILQRLNTIRRENQQLEEESVKLVVELLEIRENADYVYPSDVAMGGY